MASTAGQASSWALAAEVAAALGSDSIIVEMHPGGGEYDVLLVAPRAVLDGAPTARVLLNRAGTLQVKPAGDEDHVRLGTDQMWDDLAAGRLGIAATTALVLETLGVPDQRTDGRVEVLAWRVLAAVLAQAALYGLPWSVRSAAIDTSGYADDDVDRDLLRSFASHLSTPVDAMTQQEARRYWVVTSGEDPVACVDTGGRLLRREPSDPYDFKRDADDLSLAYSLATELVADMVEAETAGDHQERPHTPGLGLASTLGAFNRKERFFVTTQAAGLLTNAEMHGPSIPLAAPLRRRLGDVLGLNVPAHAYATVDYHLSWLHAGLAWWRGDAWPGQTSDYPQTTGTEGPAWIDGSQEDIDLLVCWADDHGQHVVGVEAKAYGAWSNAQVASKVARLGAIRNQCRHDVDLRLVLMSRRRPQKLGPPTQHLGHRTRRRLGMDAPLGTRSSALNHQMRSRGPTLCRGHHLADRRTSGTLNRRPSESRRAMATASALAALRRISQHGQPMALRDRQPYP